MYAVFDQSFGLSSRGSIDLIKINLDRMHFTLSKKLHSMKDSLFGIVGKRSVIFCHKTMAAVDVAGHKRKSK